jgi:hypothetical protein
MRLPYGYALHQWLKRPEFQAALRTVRERRTRPLVELTKPLDGRKTPRHIRARVAEDLLDVARAREGGLLPGPLQ